MKEPTIAPTEKLGENTEKILARVAGVEISETIVLPTTPSGVRPTAMSNDCVRIHVTYRVRARG
jgi:hypothetical protein